MEKPDVKVSKKRIVYEKLFWLFMISSFLGVIIEGCFCLVFKGTWESHVVTLVGQFNALYGVGAVLFYLVNVLFNGKSKILKTLVIAVSATVLELICGVLLIDGIGMMAWDYSELSLNYKGIICFIFTVGWGVLGFVFCLFFEKIDSFLDKLQGKKWSTACIVLSVIMGLNFFLTAASIVRWSKRHYNRAPETKIGAVFDRFTPDEWMSERFIEWYFVD